MEFNFSFKNTKQEAPEKYPDVAVLTFESQEGTSKFSLNKKARQLLQFDEEQLTGKKVSYARVNIDASESLVLINSTNQETDNQSNLTLSNTFSSKKFLTRLEKHFGIDCLEGAEFVLLEINQETPMPALIITDSDPYSYTKKDFKQFPDEQEYDVIQEAKLVEEEYEEELGNATF